MYRERNHPAGWNQHTLRLRELDGRFNRQSADDHGNIFGIVRNDIYVRTQADPNRIGARKRERVGWILCSGFQFAVDSNTGDWIPVYWLEWIGFRHG